MKINKLVVVLAVTAMTLMVGKYWQIMRGGQEAPR